MPWVDYIQPDVMTVNDRFGTSVKIYNDRLLLALLVMMSGALMAQCMNLDMATIGIL